MSYQNIVIIGASSGALVAKALLAAGLPESHRIVLIEKLEYAYHPISSLRGAVVEGEHSISE